MAVPDAEEFIFVDSQTRTMVELAWQNFRPQARDPLDERVPFEVVHYLPQAETTMKRLPAEFHAALLLLAERQKPTTPAAVISLPGRQDQDT